ncbi:MAG: hypothetical protein AAGA66_07600 [Bacteroidota bacterium]
MKLISVTIKHIITFSVLLLVGIPPAIAQDKIAILARTNETTINLRWAPTSSLVWELANKYGYTVERYTMVRDTQNLSPRNYNLLTSPVLRPASEATWEPLVEQDDYAAIVAQAIYGETFELTESFDKDIFQVAQKTQERDQRFSFALFACDQSFSVAKLSGLGYTDEQVKEGEKYLYKVYANVPQTILEVDTAVVFVGLGEQPPLPKIREFKAGFSDKKVVLSWKKTLTDRFYNAFWIEKSTDGGDTYRSISETPIINAYSEEGKGATGTYFKLDTLELNNQETFYRIRGVNPFGETGPYSDIVSGRGSPTITAHATITYHRVDKEGAASIQWEYPQNQEKLIEGFILKVAKTPKGPFNPVTGQMIPRQERNHTITNPQGTGYYSIGLLSGGEELNFSFPYLIQLEDSIPPAVPQDVEASISSQGKVAMKWKSNTEDDFWGYRIFRSNFKQSEFSEITTSPISSSLFEDSLSLDNLTEKIYYKVVAVDKRDNRSEASEVIALEKPDVVPPAPPVIRQTKGLESGAYLEWAPSGSKDVMTHRVYRGVRGSSQWELIANVDSLHFFLDTAVQANQPHLYTVLAVDDAGLESTPAKPVRVSKKASISKVSYEGFSGRSERENKRVILFWRLEDPEIEEIKVYRSVGDQPMSLYRTIGNTEQFTDEQVVQNETYGYQLKAVMKSGLEAGFSERVEVKY